MGFIFPLFITQMCKCCERHSAVVSSCIVPTFADNNLGYSWAAFLLACIAYILAVIRKSFGNIALCLALMTLPFLRSICAVSIR